MHSSVCVVMSGSSISAQELRKKLILMLCMALKNSAR